MQDLEKVSMIDRVANLAASAVRASMAAAHGQRVVADSGLRDARLRICAACPSNQGSTCGRCGCVLAVKTRSYNDVCPIGLW